ncbi:MAG: serine protease [Candidatus Altiarchaeota archaeon]|nr:serine protease [Candidatus Altiarchaeota archaeon]
MSIEKRVEQHEVIQETRVGRTLNGFIPWAIVALGLGLGSNPCNLAWGAERVNAEKHQVQAHTHTHPETDVLRLQGFKTIDEREKLSLKTGKYASEDIRAPGDLTNANADNPLIKHYFFDKKQVKIPAVSKACDAVFTFETSNEIDKTGGTGVIISDDGLVVTAEHCLVLHNGPNDVKKLSINHLGKSIPLANAEVIFRPAEGYVKGVDIAILRVPELAGKPHVSLSDADVEKQEGKTVFSIGYPYQHPNLDGKTMYVSAGNVKKGSNDRSVRSDAEARIGNSGGPLVDVNGLLLGINTTNSMSGFTDTLTAEPSKVIKEILVGRRLWPLDLPRLK